MMIATRWVLTIPTSDGPTVHVYVGDEAEGRRVVGALEEAVARQGVDLAAHELVYDLVEVPATWECRGDDGCVVMA